MYIHYILYYNHTGFIYFNIINLRSAFTRGKNPNCCRHINTVTKILTSYCIDLYNTKHILSCLNKQILTLLVVTTTKTHTLEEAEEAFAAKEIAEITLQSPNHYLKVNCEMGAYRSSLSTNAHIEPHISKQSIKLCQSNAHTKVTNISTMQFTTMKSWTKLYICRPIRMLCNGWSQWILKSTRFTQTTYRMLLLVYVLLSSVSQQRLMSFMRTYENKESRSINFRSACSNNNGIT